MYEFTHGEKYCDKCNFCYTSIWLILTLKAFQKYQRWCEKKIWHIKLWSWKPSCNGKTLTIGCGNNEKICYLMYYSRTGYNKKKIKKWN